MSAGTTAPANIILSSSICPWPRPRSEVERGVLVANCSIASGVLEHSLSRCTKLSRAWIWPPMVAHVLRSERPPGRGFHPRWVLEQAQKTYTPGIVGATAPFMAFVTTFPRSLTTEVSTRPRCVEKVSALTTASGRGYYKPTSYPAHASNARSGILCYIVPDSTE